MGASIAAPNVYADDGVTIGGFVDGAYYNDNKTGTSSGITLDQVELDVTYSKGKTELRFDLNATPSAAGTITSDNLIEQGYMSYAFSDLAKFTLGKFNAPIGWELLDAPDMYQYSHALVFNLGLPTNLTGAMLSGGYEMIDYSIYAVNGTDTPFANAGAGNGSKGAIRTFGGRLGVTPFEGFNLGGSFITGDNIAGTYQPQKFKTFDIDITYSGIENLVLGGEFNDSKDWTGASLKSGGMMFMGHYDMTEMFGATLRYDMFDTDKVVAGKQTAYTVALTSVLEEGMGALIEYRSDRDTTAATATTGSFNSYAFEMTYSF
ncbi:MAG: outer membrane beta-barrel protein [Zetaproteobacteria bacterium]|nr:outer membrane beta-barrel protein [Zetaproteobacteria bacterium]